MRVRNFLILLCLLIMLVLTIPVIAAADNAQVNVTPPDAIAPTDTGTPLAPPGFNPLESLVGIRKDNYTDRAVIANLSSEVLDNRPVSSTDWWVNYDIIGNQTPIKNDPVLNLTSEVLDNRPVSSTDWWDNYDITGNQTPIRNDPVLNLTSDVLDNRPVSSMDWWDNYDLIGNQTPIRNDPVLNLTDQTTSNDLRQQSQKDQGDLYQNAGNPRTSRRVETDVSRSEIISDRVNQSVNYQDIMSEHNRLAINNACVNDYQGNLGRR